MEVSLHSTCSHRQKRIMAQQNQNNPGQENQRGEPGSSVSSTRPTPGFAPGFRNRPYPCAPCAADIQHIIGPQRDGRVGMSASLTRGQNTRMAALVLLVRVRVSGNCEIGALSSHVESSNTARERSLVRSAV